MARLSARCYTCDTNVRGLLVEHNATATHRAKVARENMPRSTAKERPSWMMSYGDQYADVTEEEHAEAMRKMYAMCGEPAPLDFSDLIAPPEHAGPLFNAESDRSVASSVEPYPLPAVPPIATVLPGVERLPDVEHLDPCPRCGRADFKSAKGRDWHLANNPDCARWRKPERHVYAFA